MESSVSSAKTLNPYVGRTNKFIFPPYDFSVADCMITNFHTPKSTLLMMISAFMGHDLMRKHMMRQSKKVIVSMLTVMQC